MFNGVYHFNTFPVKNKVYLSFKQKSGLTKGIKQKISVKVFPLPPNGHGDCATDPVHVDGHGSQRAS